MPSWAPYGQLVRASLPDLRFTADDADTAWDEWGANCGPGAIAAVCGLSLAELRPHLPYFEKKGYTNPTLMWWRVLDELAASWVGLTRAGEQWPQLGVVRVQWHRPWMAPGLPARARYSHTHWIACCDAVRSRAIFDITPCAWVAGSRSSHETRSSSRGCSARLGRSRTAAGSRRTP